MSWNEDFVVFGISQSEDGVWLSQIFFELLFDGFGVFLSIDVDFVCGVDDIDFNFYEY